MSAPCAQMAGRFELEFAYQPRRRFGAASRDQHDAHAQIQRAPESLAGSPEKPHRVRRAAYRRGRGRSDRSVEACGGASPRAYPRSQRRDRTGGWAGVRRFSKANVCSLDATLVRRRGRLGRRSRPPRCRQARSNAARKRRSTSAERPSRSDTASRLPPNPGPVRRSSSPSRQAMRRPADRSHAPRTCASFRVRGRRASLKTFASAPLGLGAQTLHLTLLYTGGVVRIEGALLTPGAITIK